VELPVDKTTHVLIAKESQMKRLAIGSSRESAIIPGF
jgi:hypothetical protein